jgi:thiamine-monophosphate kinase
MMDLSDGLSSDLPRLCLASGFGARVEAWKLPPISVQPKELGRKIMPHELALNGGDDYELLFAVSPRKARFIPRSFQGVPLTAIGEITPASRLHLIDDRGGEHILRAKGWDPFRVLEE